MNQEHRVTIKLRAGDEPPAWLDIIQKKVESLRFGVVQIVVHDSEVVQIERTERIRFDNIRPARTRKSDFAEGQS